MTVEFLADGEAWSDITAYFRNRRRGAASCAIAYVGKTAPSHLPLRSGDVLVCNASAQALSSGATSSDALLTYLDHGVTVFNDEILHAKVIAVDRVSWVGSANASFNSASLLAEAVIRTSDTAVRHSIRTFVNDRSRVLLDRSHLEGLAPHPPKAREKGAEYHNPRTPTEPLVYPSPAPAIKIFALGDELWDDDAHEFYEDGEPAALAARRRSHLRADISGVCEWNTHMLKVGDWLCRVSDDGAMPPEQVFAQASRGTMTMSWTFIPPQVSKYEFTDELEPLLHDAGMTGSLYDAELLSGKTARALMTAFVAKRTE